MAGETNRQGNAILSVGSTHCSMSYPSPVTWTDGKVTKKSQIWGLFTRRHQKNGKEHVCRPSRHAWGKWDIWVNDVLSVHHYDKTPRTLSFQGGKMDFCLNNSEVPICLLGPAVLAYPGSGFMVSRHSKGNCLCSPPVGTKVSAHILCYWRLLKPLVEASGAWASNPPEHRLSCAVAAALMWTLLLTQDFWTQPALLRQNLPCGRCPDVQVNHTYAYRVDVKLLKPHWIKGYFKNSITSFAFFCFWATDLPGVFLESLWRWWNKTCTCYLWLLISSFALVYGFLLWWFLFCFLVPLFLLNPPKLYCYHPNRRSL